MDEVRTIFTWDVGGKEKPADDIHARDYTRGELFVTGNTIAVLPELPLPAYFPEFIPGILPS